MSTHPDNTPIWRCESCNYWTERFEGDDPPDCPFCGWVSQDREVGPLFESSPEWRGVYNAAMAAKRRIPAASGNPHGRGGVRQYPRYATRIDREGLVALQTEQVPLWPAVR